MIGLGHALSHSLAPQGVVTPPFVGVLDGFAEGMIECWSHRRKLVSSYSGNLLQGRRTSDDELLDVPALPNGELDAAELLIFAGGNSVGVAALRGQVQGLDMLQPTADEQRIIVDTGSLVTVGDKAASRGLRPPSGLPDHGGILKTNTFTTYTGTVVSLFLRGKHGVYSGWFNGIVDAYFAFAKEGEVSGLKHPGISHSPDGTFQLSWTGNTSGLLDSDYLISAIWDSTNVTLRDGTRTYAIEASPIFDFNRFVIGAFDDLISSYCSDANAIQEAAVWFSDQTANEAAIRSALMP